MKPTKVIFKERTRIWHPAFNKKLKYETIEYQCPICNRWFSYCNNGPSSTSVKHHITLAGKTEAVAKALGELKKTPHFDFWKQNTYPMESAYKRREWSIY